MYLIFWYYLIMQITKKNIIIVLTIFVLCSCSSTYNYPQKRAFNNSVTTTSSFDNVWSKIIAFYGSNNISVKSLEKASGFIAAEPTIPTDTMFDCGTAEHGPIVKIKPLQASTNAKASLNTVVKSESPTRTKVTINTSVVGDFVIEEEGGVYKQKKERLRCVSTGYLEKLIFDSLK